MWLAERYYTLDSLQAMAIGDESLAGLFSVWDDIDEFKPAFADVHLRRLEHRHAAGQCAV